MKIWILLAWSCHVAVMHLKTGVFFTSKNENWPILVTWWAINASKKKRHDSISNSYTHRIRTLWICTWQYVPGVLGGSLSPFEGWGRERGTLCPLVWGGTPYRWPCAGSFPAPLLYWSSRRRWAVGSRSKRCLQSGKDSKVDNVRELSSLVKAAMPLGVIWRGTNNWTNKKIWSRQSLFNWFKGHLLIYSMLKGLWLLSW